MHQAGELHGQGPMQLPELVCKFFVEHTLDSVHEKHREPTARNYEPSWLATFVNVVLARLPMLVTAVKQTTIMSDNITAYSTAVGPSSLFKKRFNFMAKFFIWIPSDR